MSKEKKDSSYIPHPSSLIPRLRRALRGEVDARTLMREAVRRSRVARTRRQERANLELLNNSPARLFPTLKSASAKELLEHFRERSAPVFLQGFSAALDETADCQRAMFSEETESLINDARRIAQKHCWPLLGFGEKCFGEKINWRRDPLSGYEWPLDFHADITFQRNDGSDVRVLWELNRFNHFLALARAYALTKDETLSREFFLELEEWRLQNPVGLGANWSCAMEVALRAMNLLAAFEIFRRSEELTEERLVALLAILDQHGAHIRRNLEFSYIATSNHYLSDVVGLLWLGVMLPELEASRAWRRFGIGQLLREMDNQVLDDGADFESSTGYHRLVLELFLYSFILCRQNNIEIEERYWSKLRQMFEYACVVLRPDGRAPLIGDTDSGRVLPVRNREASDHAYLLALGATLFNEPRFKSAGRKMPEELLWILGRDGVRAFESLPEAQEAEGSRAFPDAGTYIQRDRDLYLLFNASGVGARGRGSHGHNDALSLEVSACGVSFIIDPGTYVYTANLKERNIFRSTRYHSTVEVDGAEQNTTDERTPFVLGDEAHPSLLVWETTREHDLVAAEHTGYKRLREPVTCRRSVRFDKRGRFWLVEDKLEGAGEHDVRFRFHLAGGLAVQARDEIVEAADETSGARLFIAPLSSGMRPELERVFMSRDYGSKLASLAACWTAGRTSVPLTARWAIVPVCASESEVERLTLITSLRAEEK